VLDAVNIEKQGTPVAAVCTDAFDGSAHAVARSHGIPWYPFAVVEHPIGPMKEDELRSMGRKVVDRVQWLLSPDAREAETDSADPA